MATLGNVMNQQGHPPETAAKRSTLGRALPLAVLAVGCIAGIALISDYLGYEALAEHYQALLAYRDAHFAASVSIYMLIYIAVVAFSIPGAVWVTLVGGFLFGFWLGLGMVAVSATIGAVLIFLAARTALGEYLRAKAGRWLERLESGFREGETSFLLIMRLVPIVPFFVANLVPAFLGASLRKFMWTTLLGILPGTAVYVSVGVGLGEQLAKGERPDLGVIFDPWVLGPLLGLAALAALPLVMKRLGWARRV